MTQPHVSYELPDTSLTTGGLKLDLHFTKFIPLVVEVYTNIHSLLTATFHNPHPLTSTMSFF